jgi:hypothetical protein
VLANILGFLQLKDIMCKRRLNKKTMEAVRKTIVPISDFCFFCVESVVDYNTVNVMTRAVPNLQQISLGPLDEDLEHKYSDGEDPNEGRAAYTADWTPLDIEIISNFRKLRVLEISWGTNLNGRYPFLFNSFPLLQKLYIQECLNLKWDLEMLAGFPVLKELQCVLNIESMTGNINSLRVLKDTLEKVTIKSCSRVEGNFMDLADFPHLKILDLDGTAITGDIRDIGDNDFASLERLTLPHGVYGGNGHELQRISDAPELVRSLYILKKQRPTLLLKFWHGELSKDSPDWWGPTFKVRFVEAGSRIGYRWESFGDHDDGNFCDVNWLDPEPDRESNGYEKYTEDLQRINSEVNFYEGFHQPPTVEEYGRLLQERQGYRSLSILDEMEIIRGILHH